MATNLVHFLLFIITLLVFIPLSDSIASGNYVRKSFNKECPDNNDDKSCINQCTLFLNVTMDANNNFLALPPVDNNCTCFIFQGRKSDYNLTRLSSGFEFTFTQVGSGLEMKFTVPLQNRNICLARFACEGSESECRLLSGQGTPSSSQSLIVVNPYSLAAILLLLSIFF